MNLLRDEVDPDEAGGEGPVAPPYLAPLMTLSHTAPRDYQAELHVWALLDFQSSRDVLVYLPTGSGKTLVGALVVSAMATCNKRKRVAFVVDKIPLMQQQAEYLSKNTPMRVISICGTTADTERRRLLKSRFDVLVITAQVFVNMLKRDKTLDPAQFSLVVFDEAHHCAGGHPFAGVMEQLRLCAPLSRPRVLGLTASPAGATDERETSRALERLERQLGTTQPAVLRTPCVFRDSLRDVVDPPEHCWVEVEESASMRGFQEAASRVLDCLRGDVERTLGVEGLLGGAASQLAGWQFVRGFAEQRHPQLLQKARLATWVAEAAEVGSRLGDAHGRAFLERVGAAGLASHAEDARAGLRGLLAWRGSDAPHLSKVVSLLRREAQSRQESFRGVVFVSTRALAGVVADVLRKLLQPLDLRPCCLVGRGEGTGDAAQSSALQRFRSGEVRLLVATSVAEEGLDIAECSIAIRLHGVRSFAAYVQSRGRARARGSTYAVVGTPAERRSFDELQKAEESLQRVARDPQQAMLHRSELDRAAGLADALHRSSLGSGQDRMREAGDPQREQVELCTRQLLGGEHDVHATAAKSPADGLDPGASDVGDLCIVAHGLPVAGVDGALIAFAPIGRVKDCVPEGPHYLFPDRLRPAGYSAYVTLQMEHSGKMHRQALLSSLCRRAPPGVWLREVTRTVSRWERESLQAKVEAGGIFAFGSSGREAAFCPQARFRDARVQMGPKCLIFRVPSAQSSGRDLEDAPSETLKVAIGVSDLLDSALVSGDSLGSSGVTVYAFVNQPPKFSIGEAAKDGRSKQPKERRCCMPSALFGRSFVYAFHFGSWEQCQPFLDFLSHVGTHLCHAKVVNLPHSLQVPEWGSGWDRSDLAWTEEVTDDFQLGLCDSMPGYDSRWSTVLVRLVRSLGGPRVRMRLDFEVLYALLCAASAEPALVCAALSHDLLARLGAAHPEDAAAAVAELPSQLDSRLFVDAGALLSRSVAAAEERRGSGEARLAQVPRGHVLARCVVVTPARLNFREPEWIQSCRILQKFGEPGQHTASRFLRVQFCDEDGSPMVGDTMAPRIGMIFDHGIRINDRHFKYLHWSQSQMRSGSLWLYASDGSVECETIRRWPFLDPQAAPRNPSKYASRLALFFSSSAPTVSVSWDDVEVIDDKKSHHNGKEYCFTDGAGKIRADIAQDVSSRLGCNVVPSAFQIRYGGAKGVVVGYPGCNRKLELRKSMIKFDSRHDSFEVVSWSRNNPAFLNRQIINLLAARGIEPEVFLGMQESALLEASKVVVDPRCASRRLSHIYAGPGSVSLLDAAGVDFTAEPFFASLLRFVYRQDVRKLRQKTSIPVADASLLLGVPDESSTLRYGEVFIQISEPDPSGGVRNRIIKDCRVMVTKNPCLHPGDVLLLDAVDCSALQHVVDCVVFPVQGHRPHPDESSGSDLDGDLYFCTWCPELVPKRTAEAMDYSEGSTTKTSQDLEEVTAEVMKEYRRL
ncbi:unnamed protein product [Prorocentrum cordatum]|uniref:RNA-dependent RNA polymerase n=1 Tax=Prorocentrum cordatum TaxID=2364126 RepID=A0ABN9QW92_9DINO|nr:unnamed protein product [Polarella glacialis]